MIYVSEQGDGQVQAAVQEATLERLPPAQQPSQQVPEPSDRGEERGSREEQPRQSSHSVLQGQG